MPPSLKHELYDYLAPFYDPVFHYIYAPYRRRALQLLPLNPQCEGEDEGQCRTVLDLACGTGQNFPFLAPRLGPHSAIIGVDISGGMLRRAAGYAADQKLCGIALLQADASALTALPYPLPQTVDAVICTYGFSSIPDWRAAFENSYALLRPGGWYLIHDIHAPHRNLHSALVEVLTHTHLSRAYWKPLQAVADSFTLRFIPCTQPVFGGQLFTALGQKKGQSIP